MCIGIQPIHKEFFQQTIPVRMFWKACSTLDASSADVSINARPFFSKGGLEECKQKGGWGGFEIK